MIETLDVFAAVVPAVTANGPLFMTARDGYAVDPTVRLMVLVMLSPELSPPRMLTVYVPVAVDAVPLTNRRVSTGSERGTCV